MSLYHGSTASRNRRQLLRPEQTGSRAAMRLDRTLELRQPADSPWLDNVPLPSSPIRLRPPTPTQVWICTRQQSPGFSAEAERQHQSDVYSPL